MKFPFWLSLAIPLVILSASLYSQTDDELRNDLICREQSLSSEWSSMIYQRNYAADQTDMFYQEFHWDIDPPFIISKDKSLITSKAGSRILLSLFLIWTLRCKSILFAVETQT
jgi:hypothetical protein